MTSSVLQTVSDNKDFASWELASKIWRKHGSTFQQSANTAQYLTQKTCYPS